MGGNTQLELCNPFGALKLVVWKKFNQNPIRDLPVPRCALLRRR
jgi:hypothetical protein